MKVALVHDFLVKYGGAEKVFLDLAKLYPDAPIYTLFYDKKMDKYFEGRTIYTSKLQSYYRLIRWPKALLPMMIWAIEEFDFSDFDVVISSSNTVAHGLITKPETVHLCYCHSPIRYVWDTYHTYLHDQHLPAWFSRIVQGGLSKIRLWDKDSADRVDVWIANSKNVQRRIRKFYRKESVVIYPGTDMQQIERSASVSDYYLILSRLSPYKKIDQAIEVFNELGLPLVIIGDGEDRERLQKMAGPNIEFLGFVEEEQKKSYLRHAKALIFPGEDDFGLVPVEAMAYGRPVIALKKGGALETVIQGETGWFFDRPTVKSLKKAIESFETKQSTFSAEVIAAHASKFSLETFNTQIKELVAVNTKKDTILS